VFVTRCGSRTFHSSTIRIAVRVRANVQRAHCSAVRVRSNGSAQKLLTALQLEQPESLTCTDTPLTLVASHVLLLEALQLLLQEYAPTYSALIAPPYEFAPSDAPPELLTALQLEQPESLTCTDTPLTLVASHVLLLVAKCF